MLERATGVLGTALGGALDELEWQGWLVVEPRGYAFVARIVRDVIDRDMVTEGQRRRIRDAAGGAS
jgi:DNA-binding GntR family transcriptional regulator